MPAYPWLAERPAASGPDVRRRMRALQALGHPYSEAEIEAAPAALADLMEIDALVAYLQVLGAAANAEGFNQASRATASTQEQQPRMADEGDARFALEDAG